MRIRLILPEPHHSTSKPNVIEGELSSFKRGELTKLNNSGYNIYFFPNYNLAPLSTANLNGKDVDVWEYVFVDMDLKDGTHTRESFLSELSTFELRPTRVVSSGHGIHAYWRVTDLSLETYLVLQKRLIRKFNTDISVWKIAQLMRMPGFLNTKAADRKDWILAEIIEESKIAYKVEHFHDLLPDISTEDLKKIEEHKNKVFGIVPEKSATINVSSELPEKFVAELAANPALKELFENPTDRSKADMRIANVLSRISYTRDEMYAVLSQTSKGKERGDSYVIPLLDKVCESPLNALDGDFSLVNAIATNELIKKQKQDLIIEHKIKKEYKRTLKEIELEKRTGVYSLKNTAELRKKHYVESIEIMDKSMKDRLFCITKNLTNVMPLEGIETVLVAAQTGAGKCFRKGTKIRMFDGTVKNVENITEGEQVMGIDSKPRNVKGVNTGIEEMYEIRPVKGESYFVNKSHILSLKMTANQINYKGIKKDSIVNISVDDYLKKSNRFKHLFKGYRTGIDFQEQELKLDPYFLGLWLGDGTTKETGITTMDSEILMWLDGYVKRFANLRLVPMKNYVENKSTTYRITSPKNISKNPLLNLMRDLSLIGNKHIPFKYFKNSRENRLRLLAGLVDTDGHTDGQDIDFVFKSKQLADDVTNLCRSLGFAAYIKPCKKTCCNNGKVGDYFRISVSGDLYEIPTLLPRKKFNKRRQIKNVLNTGIKVIPCGIEQYYGFTVDGDHLFLLEDYTVVHNTTIVSNITFPLVEQGKRVLIVSTEERAEDIMLRLIAIKNGWNVNDQRSWLDNPDMVLKRNADIVELAENPNLMIVDNYTGGTDLNSGGEVLPLDLTNRDHFESLLESVVRDGFKFDLLLVDYISKIGGSNDGEQEWLTIYKTIKAIEEWCKKTFTPAIVFSQLKANNSENPQQFENRIPGAKKILTAVTCAVELVTDYEQQETTIICHKNRKYGKMFRHVLKFYKGKYVDVEDEN